MNAIIRRNLLSFQSWLNPPAPWVAILGVDGTGKSTVLNELQKMVPGASYKGIEILHRRPGIAYQKSNESPGVITHYAKSPHAPLISLLKLFIMVLDWHVGYWTRIRSLRARGVLVVADRHSVLDLLADPLRYRYRGPAWALRLAVRLVPLPEIILVFDAPLEILQARKSELLPEKIAELRTAYLRIYRQMPNACLIDASKPLKEVVDIVDQLILRETHGDLALAGEELNQSSSRPTT